VGRHAREKNGKFGGKRLVEFAFKYGRAVAPVSYAYIETLFCF
jgi:hypothetical protein